MKYSTRGRNRRPVYAVRKRSKLGLLAPATLLTLAAIVAYSLWPRPKQDLPRATAPRPYPGVVEQIENPVMGEGWKTYKNKHLGDWVKSNIDTLILNQDYAEGVSNDFSELSKYDDYLTRGSDSTGIEKNMLYAVYATESKGDLNACSYRIIKYPSGAIRKVPLAVGGAQFIEQTARFLGMIDDYVDMRKHPEAFVYGAKYLEYLGFHDSQVLALARYNAGETRINRIVKNYCRKTGIKPEDLNGISYPYFPQDLFDRFPEETREYIVRIFSRKAIKDQSLIYYVPQPLFQNRIAKTVKPRKGQTLYQIAEENGTTVSELEDVNPQIKDKSYIAADRTEIAIPRN